MPSRSLRAPLLALSLAAFAAACGEVSDSDDDAPDDGADSDDGTDDAADDGVPVDGPTYHRDAHPILQAHCAGCHTEGGIAPFSGAREAWSLSGL
jgi:cytochrome c5